MNKLVAACKLLFDFIVAVVGSGWSTAMVIVRAGRSVQSSTPAAFVRIAFAPMSAGGAAVLGCMVSLTPGSTTIDIDLPARELLVHLLDGADAPSTVVAVRERFEPALVVLFPAKS